MFLTFDTETQGFTKKIICGTVAYRNKKKEIITETFNTKEEIWNCIQRIANEEDKKGRNAYSYAHNLNYDYWRIVPKEQTTLIRKREGKGLVYYRVQKPVIIFQQNEKGKAQLYFLDTMNFWRGGLSEAAKRIGKEKMELPESIQKKLFNDEEQKFTKKEIETIKEYNKKDAIITLELIEYVRDAIKSEGLRVSKLITPGQVAIKMFNQKIRKLGLGRKIFYLHPNTYDGRGRLIKKGRPDSSYKPTTYTEKIWKAGRGGRFQALQIGYYPNCSQIDCNSLYPYAATLIDFPDLDTEQHKMEPLTRLGWEKEELLNRIGVSNCILEKPEEKIGSCPIVQWHENQYPKNKMTLIGSWTHNELRYLESIGYKIKAIKESVIWKSLETNPLKEYMLENYERRKKHSGKKEFYKMIMNNLIGKFCQKNTEYDTKIDGSEQAEQYLKEGWQIIGEYEGEYLYKSPETTKKSKHYLPIVSYTVWAEARKILHQTMNKFKPENVLYTATDSIIYTGKTPGNVTIGTEMGEWKKELENEEVLIYGKNNYMIGKTIKLGGFQKKGITPEAFRKGIIHDRQTILPHAGTDSELWGTMKERISDINLKRTMWYENEERVEYSELLIDEKEEPETLEYYEKEGYL